MRPAYFYHWSQSMPQTVPRLDWVMHITSLALEPAAALPSSQMAAAPWKPYAFADLPFAGAAHARGCAPCAAFMPPLYAQLPGYAGSAPASSALVAHRSLPAAPPSHAGHFLPHPAL